MHDSTRTLHPLESCSPGVIMITCTAMLLQVATTLAAAVAAATPLVAHGLVQKMST